MNRCKCTSSLGSYPTLHTVIIINVKKLNSL